MADITRKARMHAFLMFIVQNRFQHDKYAYSNTFTLPKCHPAISWYNLTLVGSASIAFFRSIRHNKPRKVQRYQYDENRNKKRIVLTNKLWRDHEALLKVHITVRERHLWMPYTWHIWKRALQMNKGPPWDWNVSPIVMYF